MISTRRTVRGILGAGTLTATALGFVIGDARWFAMSGFLGTLWWLWDFLMDRVFGPLGEAAVRLLQGDMNLPPANLRPTARETIQLLESRLETPVSARADVAVALRLADLYRAVLKDPVRAQAIIEMMKARYPGNAELANYTAAHGHEGGG